jgi:hypothetical protein
MLHWRHPRQLPLETRLKMEMLISDLGGEPTVAFRRVQEANKDLRARDLLGVSLRRLRRRSQVQSTHKGAVFHSAVALILVGVSMVLVELTNPAALTMATAALLIGVAMIAFASFAGL